MEKNFENLLKMLDENYYHIIEIFKENAGNITIEELCLTFKLKKSVIYQRIKNLQDLGILERSNLKSAKLTDFGSLLFGSLEHISDAFPI